jgi:hypothetical protein
VSTLRRTPLNARSAKAQQVARARVPFKAGLIAERGATCEARELVPDVDCWGPLDAHERRRRSQGGDVLDGANVALVCRGHHEWIGGFPVAAHAVGLVVWSWESDADTFESALEGLVEALVRQGEQQQRMAEAELQRATELKALGGGLLAGDARVSDDDRSAG